MANPQPDEFTRISNELLEALCKIKVSGVAMSILLVVFRKTYGFNKKKDKVSLTQFSNLTNISVPNCSRAIKKLENMNLILVDRGQYVSEYSIQKDYDKWLVQTADTLKNESKSTLNSATVQNFTDTLNSASDTLQNESESTLRNESNNRKERNYTKEIQKKGNIPLTVQNIWQRSFSRTPNYLEQETTKNIIKKFGEEKTLRVFQEAVRKNFKSVFTLEVSLDESGEIKPRGTDGKFSNSSTNSNSRNWKDQVGDYEEASKNGEFEYY